MFSVYAFRVAEQPRNPRNALGPFYVVKGHCVSCGAPQAEAPGLVTLDDDGCYFHRQPETPAEVNDAIRAMFVSCIEAYRYGGDDPTIRRRLAELGHSHLCDSPLEGHPVAIRNRVRFALVERGAATDVARLVLSWFEGNWKDGRCTKPVTGDSDTAVFEYTHSETYGTARRYTLERLPTPPLAPATAYRAPSTVHAWVLAEDEGRYPPIWLHSVLERNGALGIRWLSRDEWTARADGAELPY
jgi:hypothetical protein